MAADGQHGSMLGAILGGFRLVELIGVGGMAEVYRGLARETPDVAVKVLPAELARDQGYVTRFRVEAKRAFAVRHPNVVPVLASGEEQGVLFIIMPLLRTSLRERMDRDGPCDPVEAIRLALEVAEALDAAHSFGIMHRDVKPENILLDSDGRALLTDFGIARDLDLMGGTSATHTLSVTGLPVGTPEYMAPEQLNREPFDQRIDIYSLGVVLYEMLTGVVPHDAATPLAVAVRVINEKVPPPSMHRPAIWPALDRAVLTAMASDPNDRYPNMQTFANALHRAYARRDLDEVSSVSTVSTASSSVPLVRMLVAPILIPSAADTRPTQPMPLTGGWSGTQKRGCGAPIAWLRGAPRGPLLVGAGIILFLVLLGLCALGALILAQPRPTSGPRLDARFSYSAARIIAPPCIWPHLIAPVLSIAAHGCAL